jgi:hypothetical protein
MALGLALDTTFSRITLPFKYCISDNLIIKMLLK